MFIIIAVIFAIYLLLVVWTWQSLQNTYKMKKIVFISMGLVICYIITLLIFNISQNGVDFHNEEIKKQVRSILVLIFTAINGIIFIPFVARIFYRIKENEIERNSVIKKIIFVIVLFTFCVIFESSYLKEVQLGIINSYNIYSTNIK